MRLFNKKYGKGLLKITKENIKNLNEVIDNF